MQAGIAECTRRGWTRSRGGMAGCVGTCIGSATLAPGLALHRQGGGWRHMARVGITEAAARLGLSVDSIRRRVRKGELSARRDNQGIWQVELPDDAAAVHMQPSAMPMQAPPYAVPMQPPGEANGHDRGDELADALKRQVADLMRRLDAAEIERGACHEE